MANPFKEAEKAKKKAPGNPQELVKEEVKEEETVVAAPVEEAKPVVKEEKKTPSEKVATPKKPASDLFAGLNAEKEAFGTQAYYISNTNAEKLKAMAKKKGVSTSKLLDHILSEVL